MKVLFDTVVVTLLWQKSDVHLCMYIEGRKVKVVPVDSMKLYRGNRGIAPLILNLGVRWK